MADTLPNLDQPIGALIDRAKQEFGEVEFDTVHIGDTALEVLQITHMDKYIDKLVDRARSGKELSLPLWAKVWPSCLILGYTLTRFPFPRDCSILEVGAGCAVNGMVMAKLGHRVTVSDLNPFALLFSRINVLKNGLEDRVELRQVDFTGDHLGSHFDYIIGCEVLYEEAVYASVADFMNEHLTDDPRAEIIMAMDQKRQGRKFFDRAAERFAMMKSDAKYKDNKTGESHVINMYRLKRKQA